VSSFEHAKLAVKRKAYAAGWNLKWFFAIAL
jgi:hypothetical protein